MTHTPLHQWWPLTPTEVVALFREVRAPWWIAGGYAIECAVGRPVRAHADIDVLLLRRDQHAVRRALAGWLCWAADPPGQLRPWPADETLPDTVHDVWCQPRAGAPWRLQIMLDAGEGEDWVSRHHRWVRRPVDTLGAVTADGVPYLVPEVQLFYKARSPRPKDELDLTAVLPTVGERGRAWLADALTRAYGHHPWLDVLGPGASGDG